MAIATNVAVKTAIATALRDYFANGSLEILTSGDTLLATFGLDTDGGDIAGAVWTLVFDSDTVTAGADGTAAKAQIKTAGGDAHFTGLTVGTSGADINLNSATIASAQDVQITSATITITG